MLSFTKTSSPLYPEEEFRCQKAWIERHNAESGEEKPFPFLGTASTATWFSTSENCEQDFGIRNGAEVDFVTEFRPLYAGFLPDGRKLRCRASVRKRIGRARVSRPVQAFDFTFSAPKCVSLLFAAAVVRQDQRSINALRRFHSTAIEKTIRRFRDVFVHSRSGAAGKVKHKGGDIVAAVFTHFDARQAKGAGRGKQEVGDPQLHSHVYLMNTVLCLDGKYRSLDASHFMGRRKQIGLWFRSYLGKLLRKAGFKVLPDPPKRRRVSGEIMISEISEGVERHFSRRSAQIQTYLGASGLPLHSARGRCEAARKSRRGKNRHRASPLETWTTLLRGWMELLPRVHNPRMEQVGLRKETSISGVVSDILGKHGEGRRDWKPDESEELILAHSVGILDPDDLQAATACLDAAMPSKIQEDYRTSAAPETGNPIQVEPSYSPGHPKYSPVATLRKPVDRRAPSKTVPAAISDASAAQLPGHLLKYFLERGASEQFDVILALADVPAADPDRYAFLQNLLEVPLASAPPALQGLIRLVLRDGLGQSVRSARDFPDRFPLLARRAAAGRYLLRRDGIMDTGDLVSMSPATDVDDIQMTLGKQMTPDGLSLRKSP